MTQVTEEEIKNLDTDIQAMKDVAPSYDTYIRLNNTEIPALEKDLEEQKKTKESLVNIYEQVSLQALLSKNNAKSRL